MQNAFDSLADQLMYEEEGWVRENWDDATTGVSESEYEPEDVPLENLQPSTYRDFRVLEKFFRAEDPDLA